MKDSIKKEILEDGKPIIGKYITYKKSRSRTLYYFLFYYNREKFKSSISQLPNDVDIEFGKFYKILYSEKYKLIRVFFDQEITDTIVLRDAGFTTEEIKNPMYDAEEFDLLSEF